VSPTRRANVRERNAIAGELALGGVVEVPVGRIIEAHAGGQPEPGANTSDDSSSKPRAGVSGRHQCGQAVDRTIERLVAEVREKSREVGIEASIQAVDLESRSEAPLSLVSVAARRCRRPEVNLRQLKAVAEAGVDQHVVQVTARIAPKSPACPNEPKRAPHDRTDPRWRFPQRPGRVGA